MNVKSWSAGYFKYNLILIMGVDVSPHKWEILPTFSPGPQWSLGMTDAKWEEELIYLFGKSLQMTKKDN